MDDLSKSGYQVSLETGGAIDVGPVNPKVKIILDVKTPKSGESENNLWENLEKIKKNDEIKFVIEDKDDFSWSHQIIGKYELNQHQVLFSPVYNKLSGTTLANWIMDDGLEVRLQLQLHKILWGEKKGV